MKKFIVMGLLLSASATVTFAGSKAKLPSLAVVHSNLIPVPKSLHDHGNFIGLTKSTNALFQGALGNHGESNPQSSCPLKCDNQNDAKCKNKNHSKRALKLYSLQLLEGVKFGIQQYLLLHHLYQQGPLKASTQIGINMLANEGLKYIIKEREDTAPAYKTLRTAGGSAVKYGIKYGAHNYLGISSSLLIEKHKMRSFLKGGIINSGTNFTSYGIAKSGDYMFDSEYTNIKNATKYDRFPILSRGVGAAIGALIARYFLEEKLNDLAKFASEQIKDHGSEMISKIVSLTK